MIVIRGVAKHAALGLAAMACLFTGAAPAPALPGKARAHERVLPTADRSPTRAGGPLEPLPATGDPRRHGARIYRGRGFDTCSAPSLAVLRAWRRGSAYRAVGVYFGGRARACAQPRLTRAWLRAGDRMGWRFLPLYMGSQPRCSTSAAKRRHPI